MLKLHTFYAAFVCSAWAMHLQAGQLSAVLKPQIELLANCIINHHSLSQDATGVDFGNLDFGEHSAGQTGYIETALNTSSENSIKIQCNNNAVIHLIFGAGLHDTQVPTDAKNNYFHALSNGQDYVAYNLLYGYERSIVQPQQRMTLSANQTVEVNLYAQAVLSGKPISTGLYTDTITVTIEF